MSTTQTYKPSPALWGSLISPEGLEVLAFSYHGVGVRLYAAPKALAWLRGMLPRRWLGCSAPELTMVWRNASDVMDADDGFFSFDDPELSQSKLGGARIAWQRDFVGCQSKASHVAFVTGEARDDGFFNAMRWILPPLLATRGKYLMHGAAVLHATKGLLFIGPSGSGKTTMANRASWGVMGDDVAILSIDGPHPTIESAFLGQGGTPDIVPGQAYPLHAILRLYQGDFAREACSEAEAMRHVLGSLHQPVWSSLTQEETNKILADVRAIVHRVPVFSLACQKDETWERVVYGL